MKLRAVGLVMDESGGGVRRLARVGELLLAAFVVYSGVMHFKFAGFVAGIVPAWMPWRLFWAYFTGVALFAAGISIVVKRHTRLATLLLGIMFAVFVLTIHVPSLVHSIGQKPEDLKVLWSFNGTGGVNNALKDVALVLAALILAASKAPKEQDHVLAIAFAIVMMLFGIEHFVYTRYTPGIPSWSFVEFWIPGALFWGYLTGAVLLVGGGLVLVGKQARPAAIVLGITILAVAVLTYLFRVAANGGSYSELTNTMKDLGVAGGALMLAGILSAKSQVKSAPQPLGETTQSRTSELA